MAWCHVAAYDQCDVAVAVCDQLTLECYCLMHFYPNICTKSQHFGLVFGTYIFWGNTSVVGLFLLLVQRSGTHYQKTCGTRSVLWTVTDSHWRHFYFRTTSVFSALEVCYENALYKFTFDIDIWHWHCSYIPRTVDFWIRIWYHIATHLVLVVVVTLFKKA